MAACWVPFEIEVDVHVLAKATGVVITRCLGVSKGLHYVIGANEQICGPVDVLSEKLTLKPLTLQSSATWLFHVGVAMTPPHSC